jgi:hypothetical protein
VRGAQTPCRRAPTADGRGAGRRGAGGGGDLADLARWGQAAAALDADAGAGG